MKNYFELRGVDASTYPPYISAYIKDYLPDNSRKIIDIGCGYGQVLRYLKNLGYENLVGVDINSQALGSLEKEGIQIYNNLEDPYFKKPPSELGGADLVIIQHVLEHLPKDRIVSTLENIKSLLNETGMILVSVPNAQSNTGCYWAYEDFTHNVLFTAGSLLYVLNSAGYSRVEIIDQDCTAGMSPYKKMRNRTLLSLYKMQVKFWNKVTNSSYHQPSPQVFSYEVKAIAYKK